MSTIGAEGDELRPVTSLFVDVVGSTALGERLAPEEVKALIGECVTRLARAAEEFGGSVQAYMGDGLCVYFGVPIVREDDPARACRAALRMLEVAGQFAADVRRTWGIEELAIRVGVNTGRTAVGLVGANTPSTVAMGDATNVAARLQSLAAPSTALIGAETADRVRQQFKLEELGTRSLKGRRDPVTVWRLLGRSDSGEERPLGPLVGRHGELAAVAAALTELDKSGRGQIVVLSGGPGVGKSRLVREVRAGCPPGLLWLHGACRSFGGLAGSPFVEILRGWLGAEEAEDDAVVRMMARARLGGLFGAGSDDAVDRLTRILGMRVETQVATVEIVARELLEDAYVAWIERLCGQQPVVVVLEDVHWADESTIRLGSRLLDLSDRYALSVILTVRLGNGADRQSLRLAALADHPHRTRGLDLGPLSEDEAVSLVEHLLPAGPTRVVRHIVEHGEGNPLFLEELVHYSRTTGGAARRRTWTMSVGTKAVVPASIENLLVARIDALPEATRGVAQAASIIGRRFRRVLLEALTEPADLDGQLATMLRADLIREVGGRAEREYAFRHRLIHEAALSTLSTARRIQLYAILAPRAERVLDTGREDHLEMLAHYFAQADDPDRALQLLEQAGLQAAAVGAHERAIALWRRAADLAARVSDDAARARIDELVAALR